jgi:COP9 signalosome complex subunit 2
MQQWTAAIGSLYRTVFADGEGFKSTDVSQMNEGNGVDNLMMDLNRSSGGGWGGLSKGKPKPKKGASSKTPFY